MANRQPNPFNFLPIEMNQRIAHHIEADQDLCAFRVVCKATRDAIDGDNLSFWRRRFLGTFEKATGYKSNKAYKEAYQKRKKAMKFGADFKRGSSRREKACLEVLRDLILEAYSEKTNKVEDRAYEPLNINHLIHFSYNTDILQRIFDPRLMVGRKRCGDGQSSVNPLLQAIQIIFTPRMLMLDSVADTVFSFPETQRAVYATVKERPIFGGVHGLDIDMDWVLHQVNFWRYHMTRKEECTLYNTFNSLEDAETPRFWNKQLCQDRPELGLQWKGSYAFVERDDILDIRAGHGSDEQIQDEFNSELETGAFQHMQLNVIEKAAGMWPPLFEKHLRSLHKPETHAKTRAQRRSASPSTTADIKSRSFRFDGSGHDNYEDFLADGWLNPLPPQQGIPGWQRMTMMKYFIQEDDTIDTDALWAYEGVVMPGGQIMLGRWWSPNDGTGDSMYSGPFILWCVDSRGKIDQEDEEMPDAF